MTDRGGGAAAFRVLTYLSMEGKNRPRTISFAHLLRHSLQIFAPIRCKSLHPYGRKVLQIFVHLCSHLCKYLQNCAFVCESLATAHPYGRYASDGAPRAALGVEGLVRPPKICKDGCKDGFKDGCTDLQGFAPYACKNVQRFAKSAATDVQKKWSVDESFLP